MLRWLLLVFAINWLVFGLWDALDDCSAGANFICLQTQRQLEYFLVLLAIATPAVALLIERLRRWWGSGAVVVGLVLLWIGQLAI